jgi:hypothetical protein
MANLQKKTTEPGPTAAVEENLEALIDVARYPVKLHPNLTPDLH